MYTFLRGLGRRCARAPWAVIAVWVVVLAGLLGARAAAGGTFANNYTVPGSSSQAGADLLADQFPQQTINTGQLVFAAAAGTTVTAQSSAVNAAVANVGRLPHVVAATSPFAAPSSPLVDRAGDIAYATVTFDVIPSTLDAAYLAQLDAAVQPARAAGLQVEYGGGAGQIGQQPDDTVSEAVGLGCALLLLLFMFGSIVAAAIPLLSAAFSVLAGLSMVTLLAAAFTFPTAAPTVATLLGLGVAIDYGLFLVARHRERLDAGDDPVTAAATATATSGSAIVVAGSTVVVAILGLFVAGIPFVSALGVAAAIVVAVTMLAALTLVPAFLGAARGSVRSLRAARAARAGPAADLAHEHNAFARWGRRVSGSPWPWGLGALALLVVLAIPMFSIQFGQLDAGTDPTSRSSRRAYDLIAQGFGPGANGPLTVVLSTPAGQAPSLVDSATKALAATPGVASVSPAQVNQAGTAAVLTVIPTTGPQDAATTQLVTTLRDSVLPTIKATTYVTGAVAGFADFTTRTVQRLPWLIAAVVVVSLLLLTAAFRSLAIGLKAAAMNLLSVGAAYGVVVAIFQWGWGSSLFGIDEPVPIPAFVPMLMFAIVFGLSMDYEVFLISRVHEAYAAGTDAHRAVAIGIGGTARVITTAAAIMVVVFTSFVLDPDPTVKMLAIGMAVSVLVDATVVRMVLVPAVMSVLGDRAWRLPGWLDRVLPHLTLEGPPQLTGPAFTPYLARTQAGYGFGMADRQTAAHLLRRATLGPTAAEIDAAAAAGPEATVEGLLRPATPDRGAAATPVPTLGPDPDQTGPNATRAQKQAANDARRTQVAALTQWWLGRMVAAEHQLTEKMVFFWHGHWATSVQKVKSAPLMLGQLATFRSAGRGDFLTLTKAMLRDPALIFWLDGQRNTRQAPNENLARELMELFTLGIGAYTEDDIKMGARALTGATIDRATGATSIVARRHDDGPKTILGVTANFDADSYAELLVGQSAHPVFLAQRLWLRFASVSPLPAPTRDRLVAAYGTGRAIDALLRALLLDEAFAGTRGQLVKQPVEWVVGAVRQLGVATTGVDGASVDGANVDGGRQRQLLSGLTGLGQVPLRPPSVGGWPSGTAWLTTSSAQARLRLAAALAAAAGDATVAAVASGSTSSKVDALGRILAIDAWTDRSRAALSAVAGDPHRLLAVGLITPEYAVT